MNHHRFFAENGDSHQYANMIEEYEREKKEWDERNDGKPFYSFADLPPVEPSRVSYNEEGISLHVYGKYGTFDIFPWSRIKDVNGVIKWLYLLGGYVWFDGRMCKDFIDCCNHYLNLDINLNELWH